ncbi:MAG: Xaa-Pro peptidase family protein [Capsulimonadales bacterium]|nr:Xaa-Pro peptidase family protein [Capsulimonadales bacterium]
MFPARIEKVQEELRNRGWAAVAIMPGANLRYLTGLSFYASKRLTFAVVPVEGEIATLLPEMERARAENEQRIPLRYYPYAHDETPDRALRSLVEDYSLERAPIAVEPYAFRMFEAWTFEKAIGSNRFEDADRILTPLRARKDSDEIAAMRTAVKMIEYSLSETIRFIRPGQTEREIAAFWLQSLLDQGSEGPSFPLTVGSGPNGSFPHHENSDRRIANGDLIVLDGGALFQGYASDITRTVAVGEPTSEMREVYSLVQRANAAGRARATVGATGHEIDTAARTVIDSGGYGPQFLHRTGHGLGLEIHEPPFIAVNETMPLSVGATFTIEPGIYIKGRFGVRIEDMVTLTGDGAETLTTLDRELLVIKTDQ